MRSCLLAAALALAWGAGSEVLRGKLTQGPAMETADRGVVALDGDAPTRAVLSDKRLHGFDVEAKGHFTAPGRFAVDPIHMRAVLVRLGGRLKYVTYWCDVCSIRSYAPGPCWCCQRETTLDLRDPEEK